MSYQSNRLKYNLLMALGASRALRRTWLIGCGIEMGVCLLGFVILAPFERYVTVQMIMYGLWLGFFAGVAGLGTWFLACVIGFAGKQLKDDYRRDKLFD